MIGALTPAAVVALGTNGRAQQPNINTATAVVAQPATYRYTGQIDGTTEVQRSQDGGLTWLAVGTIPEVVAQLAVNPVNDTLVLARTGTGLWRSGNGGANWARIDSLPGRPIALAFAGSSDPAGLIFAGTETQGLYSGLDGGTTWQAAGGSLSPLGAGSVAVTALAVNPNDQHVVYTAATFTMATPEGRHSSQSVLISVDDGRRWFEMTPAPSFDQLITTIIPFNGSILAVSVVGPYGIQIVRLAVDLTLISGLDDPDAGIRAATAGVLGASQDQSVVPVLLQHLHDSDVLAGDQIAQAIGWLGDPAAVPLLMSVLSDTDEVMRARAATALGLLQTQEAIPQLNMMLLHDSPWAKRYAAEALAAIGTPAAIAALTTPLQDAEMTPVRYAAMQGLEISGKTAITPLRLALMNQDPVVRRNAAEMLGWLTAADAVPDLARSLADPDLAVQTQARWALGEMHTEPAQLALRQSTYRRMGTPILRKTTAVRGNVAPGSSIRQNAPVLPALLPGALARILPGSGTLRVLAGLAALAILAAMLIWKGPRRHLKPS